MSIKNQPSAKILGQISLIQSMVGSLPDQENILRFVCRGLLEVPGIDKADYRLGDNGIIKARASEENEESLQTFIMKTEGYEHGELLVCVSDAAALSPYVPFIKNLGHMLAVIFEERRQKRLVKAILADLERRVYERTKELEIEIKERKLAKAALQAEKESVEQYLDIIEVILVVLDDQAKITLLNRKGYEVLGYRPGDLDGKNWFKVCLPPEDYETMFAVYRQTLARGIAPFEYYENNILTKNGDKLYIAWHNKLLTNDSGIAIGILSSGEDITERRQAEEARRKSEENLRITLNSIGEGVISTDLAGNVIRINHVAETLTGWSQAEASGKPLTDVFYVINDQTRTPIENPVEKVLKAGKIVELTKQTILVAKDGTEYHIADSGAPIRDANNNVAGVVLVFRDITEQLKMEQEFLKAKKLESVGILAGGIAHDFNNLLTGLFGNLELAKLLVPSDHKAHKFLASAERSMDRAIDLTKQLLTFAKGGDPVKQTLSIEQVITDTAQFSIRGSKAKLQTNIVPDLWMVEADKGQLCQVISNLVINAEQAMPAGGIITIAAQNIEMSEGRFVKISVQDEGMGIASQYLDNIFDPYFTTKQKGSGLGLATTHAIVRKHNGQIRVKSQLGYGTTFTVYLPAANKTPEITIEEMLQENSGTAVPSTRILVMDDEEIVRDMLGAMLERMGADVKFTTNGQEAFEEYQTAFNNHLPFDIVVTDLTIPGGMGGKEAAQEMLKLNPQAKIIVSSGYATDPVMAHYKAYGFKGIIVKPYRFAELLTIIQKVLKL